MIKSYIISNLIEKAREIRSKINLEELIANGLDRERLGYEFIFGYPQSLLLEPISADKIYPSQKIHKVALYVHVPFCTSVKVGEEHKSCLYCSYYKKSKPTPEDIKGYLDAVKTELSILLQNMDIDVGSVLIGGGTPTFLSASQLEELLEYLFRQLHVPEGTQISVESSPETLSNEKLNVLSKWANRLNIGVQTFDDKSLKYIRRRHNGAEAKYWLETAKKYFSHVNTDLIFGLPGQSLDKFEHDLKQIGEIKPQSLSVYQLRMTNPDCIALFQQHPELFPTEEECLLMNIMQTEYLRNAGYILDPITYFSLSENFSFQDVLGKWKKQEEILGIGPSAYSFIDRIFYYNVRSLEQYIKNIEEKQLPIWIGKKLSKEEQTARKVSLGIRNIEGVDINEISNHFRIRIFDIYKKEINKLQKCGLIEIIDSKMKLTYSGILYADEVSKEFYTKRDKEKLGKLGLKYGCYFREG